MASVRVGYKSGYTVDAARAKRVGGMSSAIMRFEFRSEEVVKRAPARGIARRWSVQLAGALCVALLLTGAGCPALPPGGDPPPDTVNGNGDSTDPAEVSGKIVNITSTDIRVSALERPLAVLYDVTGTPDSIVGFFVRVGGNSVSADRIGDPRIVAEDIPAGINEAFDFDPGTAGVGFFRVGIVITTAGEELEAISTGVIQVEGPPMPFFIRPSDAFTEVVVGTVVDVLFDTGDLEGDVQWRLFYLSDSDLLTSPEDELGTELEVGFGNRCEGCTFPTASRDPGDYELGVSATDSGSSIAATVASGDADRIVTVFGPIIRVFKQTP